MPIMLAWSVGGLSGPYCPIKDLRFETKPESSLGPTTLVWEPTLCPAPQSGSCSPYPTPATGGNSGSCCRCPPDGHAPIGHSSCCDLPSARSSPRSLAEPRPTWLQPASRHAPDSVPPGAGSILPAHAHASVLTLTHSTALVSVYVCTHTMVCLMSGASQVPSKLLFS